MTLASVFGHLEPVPVSRADAISLGLARYRTGKPCTHGHLVERYVVSRVCCECHRLRVKSKRNRRI